MQIIDQLAKELNTHINQIQATVGLLDEGATVPFIARYRKEKTGGLDDTQLRTLEMRLQYLRELADRKNTILTEIESQKKLTPELKQKIENAETKSTLEDLYLPYKPKRRTKAQIAIEKGLEPLANALLTSPENEPQQQAKAYINSDKEINNEQDALDGAKHILIERISENAELIQELRELMQQHAVLKSTLIDGKEADAQKFKDYFEFSESVKTIPSHRTLATLRGQKEGLLRVNVDLDDETQQQAALSIIRKHTNIIDQKRPGDVFLNGVVDWAWKIKLKLKLSMDLLLSIKERAEDEAINVFKNNLGHLLLAAPAGKKVTLGLDPGFRTGVKTVVVDDTGKLLEHTVIYPHPPQKQWDQALHTLSQLCKKHQVSLISIGNGTASRETDQLAKALIDQLEIKPVKIIVSEAGASVYSASELAAKEFPDLDVSYRGAVSIARRLQDPLAELVKIEPKAIGVGQYQHDVNQIKLAQSLNNVVEDCVNNVGADLNTASTQLLKSIAGLNQTLAENIVFHRQNHGRFQSRDQLLSVSRLGDKTYEQCAGFLRINDGSNPLDASCVHPEAYPLVAAILAKTKLGINELMGNSDIINQLNANDFVTDVFGKPTIKDIFNELKKPARDPRGEFVCAKLDDRVQTIKDLQPDMQLEGTITNVTNFGAFVDIGVHQDGLVHVSELANTFVKDPHQIVKPGQIVSVRVLDVDSKRKRISLSMKKPGTGTAKQNNKRPFKQKPQKTTGSLGDVLKHALK